MLKRSFEFVAVVIALFLPISSAQAHFFLETNNGTLFATETNAYKQRGVLKKWQLAVLPDTGHIKQVEYFTAERFIILEQEGTHRLLRSRTSLDWRLDETLGDSDSLTLTEVGGRFFAFTKKGAVSQTFILNANGVFTAKTGLPTNRNLSRENLFLASGSIWYALETAPNVIMYKLTPSGWIPNSSILCGEFALYPNPFPFMWCNSGEVFVPGANSWAVFSLPKIQQPSVTSSILAASGRGNPEDLYVWKDGLLYSVELTDPNPATLSEVKAISDRVLLRFTGGWYELTYVGSQTLERVTEASNAIYDPHYGHAVIFGTSNKISLLVGFWQTFTTTGVYNQVQALPSGFFFWQTAGNTGGLSHVLPFGSTVAQKVNPWSSTTSPIRATFFRPNLGLVSVVTNSGQGNVNLYKSSDFISWSRTTLPVEPTLSVSLKEARALPAGTLLETSGELAVGPGVVSDDVVYLQDDQAGIQVYLSSTHGSLPESINRFATITGEKSESQVQRITLDALDDLVLGGTQQFMRSEFPVSSFASLMGRAVDLRGLVSAVSKDYVSLEATGTLLKLHFLLAKESFVAKDQVSVPVVVDWNASAGQVEAWALGSKFKLISRPIAPAPVVAPVASSPTATISPIASSTNSRSIPVRVSSVTLPTQLPWAPQVQVSGATSNSGASPLQNESVNVLGLLSLAAGTLAMRGRRFKAATP